MVESSSISTLRDIYRQQAEIKKFTQWQLESIDIIKEMTQTLGWYFEIGKDKETKKTTIITTKLVDDPSINKEGITSLIQSLFKIVNKNTFLANLKDNEVAYINFDHMVSVLDDLIINFDYYGIADLGVLEKIRSTVENMSEIAITRGRGGTTLNYLKTVQKLIEKLGFKEGEHKIV